MTETLSTQLCKLAGIHKECLCSNTSCTDKSCKKCTYATAKKRHYIYPDFESDTDAARFNFVRLLELEYSYAGVVDIDQDNIKEKSIYVRDKLIDAIAVIKAIPNDERVIAVKQALASTDWRY